MASLITDKSQLHGVPSAGDSLDSPKSVASHIIA
jgi:hypothetical protein